MYPLLLGGILLGLLGLLGLFLLLSGGDRLSRLDGGGDDGRSGSRLDRGGDGLLGLFSAGGGSGGGVGVGVGDRGRHFACLMVFWVWKLS